MLKKVVFSVTALLLISCATTSPSRAGPIPFEVALAGDDGLTQRVVAGLRVKLTSMRQFRAAPRSPQTLIIIVPNVLSKQQGSISRVLTTVRFSRVSADGNLIPVKTHRVSCLESDLSPCFDQIAAAALKL